MTTPIFSGTGGAVTKMTLNGKTDKIFRHFDDFKTFSSLFLFIVLFFTVFRGHFVLKFKKIGSKIARSQLIYRIKDVGMKLVS